VRENGKKVIIVESPTKSKTIKSFLGNEYLVVSSKGHIKDLPKSELGVDIQNNFTPKYIKIKGKAKIIQEIKILPLTRTGKVRQSPSILLKS